jgi:hypothetical protein
MRNMGLAVYLDDPNETVGECHCHCGNKHEHRFHEQLFRGSITHNLISMARAAGLYDVVWCPEENGIVVGQDLIPYLEKGLKELRDNESKYAEYNPYNGWGDYETLIIFIEKYLDACIMYPRGIVKAER